MGQRPLCQMHKMLVHIKFLSGRDTRIPMGKEKPKGSWDDPDIIIVRMVSICRFLKKSTRNEQSRFRNENAYGPEFFKTLTVYNQFLICQPFCITESPYSFSSWVLFSVPCCILYLLVFLKKHNTKPSKLKKKSLCIYSMWGHGKMGKRDTPLGNRFYFFT